MEEKVMKVNTFVKKFKEDEFKNEKICLKPNTFQ